MQMIKTRYYVALETFQVYLGRMSGATELGTS